MCDKINPKNMKLILIIFLILSIPIISFSQKDSVLVKKDTIVIKKYNETYYRNIFAKKIKGKTKTILNDKTYVDIVTDKNVIKVIFANKWAEGIGHALYYSEMTYKKPGILILIRNKYDVKYINKLLKVAKMYYISVWIMNVNTFIYYQVLE